VVVNFSHKGSFFRVCIAAPFCVLEFNRLKTACCEKWRLWPLVCFFKMSNGTVTGFLQGGSPMADRVPSEIRVPETLMADVCNDLKRKQELLAAANRCLADEKSYRFFSHLSSLARMPADRKMELLEQMEAMSLYSEEEMGAIRRLVLTDGALAFKDLVDMVRDIRVEQEIEAMLR
jgi:hypothetical protein